MTVDRARRAKGRTNGIMPSTIRSHTLPTGELSVECWCRGAIVFVPPATVMACRTASCGRPECHGPAAA